MKRAEKDCLLFCEPKTGFLGTVSFFLEGILEQFGF